MTSVDVQFVLGMDWTSTAIAWFNSGHFSHVDALALDGKLTGARSDVCGGIRAGVQTRPAGYAKWRRRVVFSIPCTEEQRQKFWDFIIEQRGKPYDKLAIIAFMIDRNWRDLDAWFCSELILAALIQANICPPLFMGANKVPPTTLAWVVSSWLGVAIRDLSTV